MEERGQFGAEVMRSNLPVVVEVVEGESRQFRSLDEADRWAGFRGWERHARAPGWEYRRLGVKVAAMRFSAY